MIVAPTEPPSLRAVAHKVSMFPETMGCDVVIRPHRVLGKGWIGIQRKEVADLVSSITDGRLTKELNMMDQCLMGFLIVEGKMNWTMDGELMNGWGDTLGREAMESMMWTIMAKNIHVVYTEDLRRTVEWCQRYEKWARKSTHTSVTGRPGPVQDAWGTISNRAWQQHLLMGFPGIGVTVADAMIEHFGGRVPLKWAVERREMGAVKGLGPKRIDSLYKSLMDQKTQEDTQDIGE